MTGAGLHVRWPDGGGASDLPPRAGETRSLADQLANAGQPLNVRCGQRGLCGGCTVELVAGRFRRFDGAVTGAPAEVKACQGFVSMEAGATIAVPARSLATHPPSVATSFKVSVSAAHAPLVRVVAGQQDHGLAIDVGTTTVVVALVDLVTGGIVGEESAFNRQIEFGDNVLTRIQVAGSPERRDALREAVVGRTLEPLVRRLCARTGLAPDRLAAAVVAGNTTMLHLLTGTDPTPLGVAPFRAAFTAHRVLIAAELGLRGVGATMPVHLLPSFGAYVGADLVAGSVCTGLINEPGPSLLVDIGTNGEILLRHEGRLLATAAAAGPAFEGGRLARGTRAVAGAIAHVAFPAGGFPPEIECIPGGASTIGLCGSAYVDFLAEGRRTGLLTASGRFSAAAWRAIPDDHRHVDGQLRGVCLRRNDPSTLVTEADVAELLQAKGAIAAAIVTLLRRARLAPTDVRRIYLAGGFGLHLDVVHAIDCGLLPGFEPAQVEVVDNTALGGAWLALVDRGVLPEMNAASVAADIVELNLEPGFEDTFIDQLTLP